MTRFPKIAQARLQRMGAETAETHPDADLLTAFAEQSLRAAERESVMRHLAGCGDCREVVALALPESEIATAGATHVGRRWFSWPVLRWGVVAAGVVLVSAVGVLQYKTRPQQSAALVSNEREGKLAAPTANQSAGQAAASQKFAAQTLAAAPKPRTTVPLQSRNAAPAAAPANEPVSAPRAFSPSPQSRGDAPSGGGMAGGVFAGIGSGSGGGQGPKSNPAHGGDLALSTGVTEAAPKPALQNPTAQNSAAGANETVEVSGASQVLEVQSETTQIASQNQEQDELAKNGRELPAQKQPLNNLDVVKAKDSPPPQADSSVAFAPMVSSSGASLQMLAATRWAISSSGGLQRSFDAGQTWEQVNVTEVALGARLTADRAAAEEVKIQEKKVKRNKKAESNGGIVFRALAVIGPEVWAGGSAAALYHSPDSGASWTRVFPRAASASLTGDVTGVELADQEHARVATSTGQVWVTADHGQTWHQQQ